MAHTLPFVAHGNTLPIVAAKEKFEGSGENKKKIGEVYTALYPADGCAHIPITVSGANTTISQTYLNDRNVKMDFVMAKFKNLVITFTGGDFGSINYRGTADAVEFLNITPAAPKKEATNP